MRVWGWDKAKALLEWEGYGLQHHPARKGADFPTVWMNERP